VRCQKSALSWALNMYLTHEYACKPSSVLLAE
jgi:hypothetical protein